MAKTFQVGYKVSTPSGPGVITVVGSGPGAGWYDVQLDVGTGLYQTNQLSLLPSNTGGIPLPAFDIGDFVCFNDALLDNVSGRCYDPNKGYYEYQLKHSGNSWIPESKLRKWTTADDKKQDKVQGQMDEWVRQVNEMADQTS